MLEYLIKVSGFLITLLWSTKKRWCDSLLWFCGGSLSAFNFFNYTETCVELDFPTLRYQKFCSIVFLFLLLFSSENSLYVGHKLLL